MARKDMILDGLAWASLSEPARIALISANLVRKLTTYLKAHTKTAVKDEVRATSPPYGRGKIIAEAVEKEYRRQAPIYQARQKAHNDFKAYQEHMAKRSTRLNNTYAAAFDRIPYDPTRTSPYNWDDDWELRDTWSNAEHERDKGDECIGLTHQGSHVVCLMKSEDEHSKWHIATRLHKGPRVRTYLRCNHSRFSDSEPKNLVEAAMSLGGPKVRTAITRGKRVVTDWIGRRTFIHHDGSDYHHVHIEELPWRAVVYEMTLTGNIPGDRWSKPCAAVIHGETVTRAPDEDPEDDSTPDQWNDLD